MTAPSNLFGRFRRLHFIGIGGIGMSGIAEFLLNRGYKVTGSDRQLTEVTEKLEKLGATVYEGHASNQVEGSDFVVYSSAVSLDNPEIIAAQAHKIPVIRRAEMLAELMRMKNGIAIAGTHGKTTTTSMIGMVLTANQLDPTVIVGGKVSNFGSNAKVGDGEYMVVEADEYDRSFLTLTPTVAIITSLEPEHLDIYPGGIDEIKKAFAQFANRVPFFGLVIVCLDEPHIQDMLPMVNKRIMTYGLTPQADVQAINIRHSGLTSTFSLVHQGENLGEVRLNIPGVHNIKNALAAISVGLELELPFDQIKKGLDQFSGVQRRFTVKYDKGPVVIDDYAHHPTEVQSTLKAARDAYFGKNIIGVFQPHLYTRTRDFKNEFARSFLYADSIVLLDIYAARENPIDGIHSSDLVELSRTFGHKNAIYKPTSEEVLRWLRSNQKPDDIIVFMGAGDITKIAHQYAEELSE